MIRQLALAGVQMIETNKRVVRRLFEEAVSQGRIDVIDRLYAADFVDRCPGPGQGPGAAGIRQVVERYRAAFPDLTVTVEDIIAEGDTVALRETWRGTQRGAIGGLEPSGRTIEATRMHFFRLRGGLIVEEWSVGDVLARLR